ncbi:hypothetical protein OUZ56_011931 [Daphnia magna]|uniref:Uncharacterized protein n=1 Tax=Daphnia magna TaxID=35525 RepID=A0ABQ9Z1M6_9CRUS|nr:hypothetical protein OUZ56_011931 [Daphnia magna]
MSFYGHLVIVPDKISIVTTPSDCNDMINHKKCNGNEMKASDNKYVFYHEPKTLKYWMSTVTAEIINCDLEKVQIYQQSEDTNFQTPIGTASATAGNLSHNHLTLAWDTTYTHHTAPVNRLVESGVGTLTRQTEDANFTIPRKKNTPAAKLRRKLIRKDFRQEQYRFQHIKDLEPAYRETASETTARPIAQRRPTEDMQTVILPAPQLSTPELLPRIQAALKVAEFILKLSSVSDSQPSQLRPPLEPISQPQAADPTPRRIRLDYFRSAGGRDTETPPQPPEALRAALVKSAQSRRKTEPRLADLFSPPSQKKPRFYRPYSPRPVEQLPDPPTPPGVPESEPDDFVPNLSDCEVRSEVGETEVEPAHVEPEQPANSWRIRNTRTQIVRTVTSSQLFENSDQQPQRK